MGLVNACGLTNSMKTNGMTEQRGFFTEAAWRLVRAIYYAMQPGGKQLEAKRVTTCLS